MGHVSLSRLQQWPLTLGSVSSELRVFIPLHRRGLLGAKGQAPVTQFQRAHCLGAMK